MRNLLSIGEFSRAAGLTIKALRYYHEIGLLIPERIEVDSGYRFYTEHQVDTARAIVVLKQLGFTIQQMKEILAEHADEATLIEILEQRKQEIAHKIENQREMLRTLEGIISKERDAARRMTESGLQVSKVRTEATTVASCRHRGAYQECGPLFGKLARKYGRHICGKPMLICHDEEYKEVDADFEAAFPIRKGGSSGKFQIRELPAQETLSLMHLGPYNDLQRSYLTLIKYARQQDLQIRSPSFEIYHKGPGVLLRGNPKKYLTEIRIPLCEEE